MAGPTPVSALIQAVTIVTAGVYLKVRSHTLFALAPATIGLVAWVDALIALVGSAIAIGQYDIEKVLAYDCLPSGAKARQLQRPHEAPCLSGFSPKPHNRVPAKAHMDEARTARPNAINHLI